MTSKQRLLSALRGERTDRVPFAPNLAYWLDFQPKELREADEVSLIRKMGGDPMIRAHIPHNRTGKMQETVRCYREVLHQCSISNQINGRDRLQTIQTPLGFLEAKYVLSPNGETWFLSGHPVKTEKDFAIVRSLFDHIELVPDYQEYDELAGHYGDDALIIPMLAPEINLKSAFQSMVEFWLGTEELTYAVADVPEEIEATIRSMRQVSRQAALISAKSNAEIFITWEDTSTTNISPAFYEKYILPEINEWCEILHEGGKMYMQHACGHLRNILSMMDSSKINGIESISPPPTGDIEMKEARAVMRRDMFLVGGIEPTILLNSTMEELEQYTLNLLDDMAGYPFVLANSDSCPPGVSYNKFELIAQIIKTHAKGDRDNCDNK